jgi:hypothetical protein
MPVPGHERTRASPAAMAGLRSFRATLQTDLAPTGQKWEYSVPNLPKPDVTNPAQLIKCISYVSSTR